MLKRESVRSFSHNLKALWSCRSSMALYKPLFSANFCGFSQSSEANGKARIHRKVFFDMGIGPRVVPFSKVLKLRSSMDRYDGTFRRADDEAGKAHVMAPGHQLVRDSENFLAEEVGAKIVNGSGACRHGKPLGFPECLVPEKLVVAVDVDEVLGSFLSALNKFIADSYSLNHSVSEYYVYEFYKIWKCSRAEADIRVHEFFKTTYFRNGIHPIPGARHALQKLSSFCDLSVVTSRQNAIKDHTLEWLGKHYPGLFQEIHFGNHFALDGQSKPKSEICRTLGAQVLIDDNPRYALECAEVGVRVLLFDYDNSYPWCKTGIEDLHPLVTKVHNWQEVEQQLGSWVAS
ncbi:uncharacterized protein [Typha angustifolia]|uniref:uncharacterized protein n=1 Tax=Typha angustifolia TaxID=59011 RepID=UPI003C2F8926